MVKILMQFMLVALFGAFGVTARYIMDRHLNIWTINEFPVTTLVINCIGSFAIGVVYTLSSGAGILPKDFAIVITVGLLGGFTTFSAFSIQTFQLMERGQYGFAATYLLGSPLLGLLCAISGVYLARIFWGLQ